MKRFLSLKLSFDRSFSGKWRFQLLWLVSGLAIMTLALYLLRPPGEEGGLWGLIGRMVSFDPDIERLTSDKVGYFTKLYLLAGALVGMLVMSGMLISVLSNMLNRRVEQFRAGHIYYRFRDHVVIFGYDFMVPELIRQICGESRFDDCGIVIQSVMPAAEVLSAIHAELDACQEKRTVVIHARRNSLEDLSQLRLGFAREAFILGEAAEESHDALNLDCFNKINSLLADKKRRTPLRCNVMFENQSTFSVFQSVDIEPEKFARTEFCPFNFYETWARKVLVNNRAGDTAYRPLDREPIDAQSQKSVCLFIIGMTKMGMALAVEAARIAHYPNFCTRGAKTHIIFVDPQADEEINRVTGDRITLFEMADIYYMDAERDDRPAPWTTIRRKEAGFLDTDFTFIRGLPNSLPVRKTIERLADDPTRLLTVAVCFDHSQQNIAAGLHLPENVYNNRIPVLIRQQRSDSLIRILATSERYREVRPFGMTGKCFDLSTRQRESRAKKINYVYNYYAANRRRPTSIPDESALDELWKNTSVSSRWANIYNADTLDTKLRCAGYNAGTALSPRILSEAEEDILAQVEHNRWNVEKLLNGFRAPTAQEAADVHNDPLLKETYKQKGIHPDICPYDQIAADAHGIPAAEYDKCIIGSMHLIA